MAKFFPAGDKKKQKSKSHGKDAFLHGFWFGLTAFDASQVLRCFKIGGSCCSYYIRPYFKLLSHSQIRLALNTLVYVASEQQ